MKRIHRGLAASLSTLGMCGVATAASSFFTSGPEGWVAQGDAQGPLTWSATGGNPDGHVFVTDAVTGGVTYFSAPAAFLGNQSGAIGQALTFDLQQSFTGGASQFDAADVILVGGGTTLVFDTPNNPANGSWTSYSVPLAAGGWHVGTLTGAAPSDAQFAAVLSNLSSLQIRAEFRTGADVDHLDNVVLPGTAVAPIPEPGTALLMLLGLAGVGLVAQRVRSDG